MGACQIVRSYRAASLMACAAACVATASALPVSKLPWADRVGPEAVGLFPPVRPFSAEFRFGWSDFDAARAKATVSYDAGIMRVEVRGGTVGLARMLWQLDATHDANIIADGLKPIFFRQVELYAKKSVTTDAVFKPDGVWRLRKVEPDPNNSAKWKRMKLEPARDIVSAMFFIRSQPLENGNRIGLVAFPGDAPFLVEAAVLGRETIKIAGVPRRAIKLDFKLKRIDTKNKNQLQPHGKFKSGLVWLSDDEDRIPLRAEVAIFVGYVFGQIDGIQFR